MSDAIQKAHDILVASIAITMESLADATSTVEKLTGDLKAMEGARDSLVALLAHKPAANGNGTVAPAPSRPAPGPEPPKARRSVYPTRPALTLGSILTQIMETNPKEWTIDLLHAEISARLKILDPARTVTRGSVNSTLATLVRDDRSPIVRVRDGIYQCCPGVDKLNADVKEPPEPEPPAVAPKPPAAAPEEEEAPAQALPAAARAEEEFVWSKPVRCPNYLICGVSGQVRLRRMKRADPRKDMWLHILGDGQRPCTIKMANYVIKDDPNYRPGEAA